MSLARRDIFRRWRNVICAWGARTLVEQTGSRWSLAARGSNSVGDTHKHSQFCPQLPIGAEQLLELSRYVQSKNPLNMINDDNRI